jgi:hypothetical protein
VSAGILAYRKSARELEVLLVHPDGPFWRKTTGAPGPFRKAKWMARMIQSRPPGASLPKNLAPALRLGRCRR